MIKRFQIIVEKLSQNKDGDQILKDDPMLATSNPPNPKPQPSTNLEADSPMIQEADKQDEEDATKKTIEEQIHEKTGQYIQKKMDNISILRSTSARDQQNLSRKERNELIDKKIIEFEDIVEQVERHLQDL